MWTLAQGTKGILFMTYPEKEKQTRGCLVEFQIFLPPNTHSLQGRYIAQICKVLMRNSRGSIDKEAHSLPTDWWKNKNTGTAGPFTENYLYKKGLPDLSALHNSFPSEFSDIVKGLSSIYNRICQWNTVWLMQYSWPFRRIIIAFAPSITK